MLDYKSIIIKRYVLGLRYKELSEEFNASKSEINDFIRTFERCEKLLYPLRKGSRTIRSTNWYTAISQVPTNEMPAMNSLISPQSLDR